LCVAYYFGLSFIYVCFICLVRLSIFHLFSEYLHIAYWSIFVMAAFKSLVILISLSSWFWHLLTVFFNSDWDLSGSWYGEWFLIEIWTVYSILQDSESYLNLLF
jgi:hypothetical protein